MKTLTYLLSLSLAAVSMAETVSLEDALGKALYTEEVSRDLESAASQYSKILETFRKTENVTDKPIYASTALFRLAEIREKQEREEEARSHYEDYLASFPDVEPQASLARKKLGIGEPEHQPALTELERERLGEGIDRRRWEFTGKLLPDQLLLTTFKVKPHEDYANEGLPAGFEVATLHHAPSGHITKRFSRSWVVWPWEIRREKDDDRWDRRIYVTGLGHSYAVPEGLVYSGQGSSTVGIKIRDKVTGAGSAQASLFFVDKKKNPTKWLTVQLIFDKVRLKKARELLESRKIDLPKMGNEAWSLTLPPSLAELEKARRGE